MPAERSPASSSSAGRIYKPKVDAQTSFCEAQASTDRRTFGKAVMMDNLRKQIASSSRRRRPACRSRLRLSRQNAPPCKMKRQDKLTPMQQRELSRLRRSLTKDTRTWTKGTSSCVLLQPVFLAPPCWFRPAETPLPNVPPRAASVVPRWRVRWVPLSAGQSGPSARSTDLPPFFTNGRTSPVRPFCMVLRPGQPSPTSVSSDKRTCSWRWKRMISKP